MKNRVVILGSGAAPGVPSLSDGWGACDSYNIKNRRLRIGTYIEYKGLSILIDTSPDLRLQLLGEKITHLDGVLYTHSHADHLNGIDDLREINRITRNSLNIYGNAEMIKVIRQRFGYLVAEPFCPKNVSNTPSLVPNLIRINKPFFIKNVKITPLALVGHAASIGFSFDNGELVYISDFKELAASVFEMITIQPKLMIFPLTTMHEHEYHADLSLILKYIERFRPEKVIINHMSTECDYDHVNSITPSNVYPAFDGMEMEF